MESSDTSYRVPSETGELPNDRRVMQKTEIVSRAVTQTFLPHVTSNEMVVKKIEGDVSMDDMSPGRSLVQRYFSKMNEGSLRGSIFSLMSASLGAGILSLPYVMVLSGLGIGSFLIIFGAFISFMSMVFLAEAQDKTGVRSYDELVIKTMGTLWGKVLEIVLIIFLFGANISYLILLATSATQILGKYVISPETASSQYLWVSIIIIDIIVIIPFALMRKVTALRYVSIVGCIACFYICAVVICESPFYIINEFTPKNYVYSIFDLNFFTAFACTVFGYTCQQIVIPVKLELVNPTTKRLIKVFRRSVLIELFVYLSTAVFAYLGLAQLTPSVIIQRPTIDPNSFDIRMNFGVCLMVVNMVVSTPINLVVCRDQLIRTLGLKHENNGIHFGFTMALLICPAIIACFFKDLISCFSILGGFGGCFIVIFYPGLCMAQVYRKENKICLAVSIALVTLFLSALGFIAAILNLLAIVGYVNLS